MHPRPPIRRRSVATALLGLGAWALGAPAGAQLTDLQPGRNFADATVLFSNDHCENLAVGDLDQDGDLDVATANGGASGDQFNRIFVNQGGLQGGTLASFVDDTALRLAGVAPDRSRDVEFVDYDADGDLDIFISNTGNGPLTGQPSRFHDNQGGAQAGTVAFFAEATDARWGDLVSVPVGDQVFGGDSGPWLDWSCDCDFGDIDDDGDLDLIQSSYGPVLTGGRDTRLFLNDGTGLFHELWPWADPSATTQLHTLNVHFADLDGDYDLDIAASSRDTQGRIFNNNLRGSLGAEPFLDVTQTALLDQQGAQIGMKNYEMEPGDLDGDGDFDLWAVNYINENDLLLENTSAEGGPITFLPHLDWLVGDTGTDEAEAEVIDFDGDGDLDVLHVNFFGENHLFQSGLAQGFHPENDGLFHRTGADPGVSEATWPEIPVIGGLGTSWDISAADLDNDGDLDVLVGNNAGEPNTFWENALGVPDTHPPVFARVSVQGDKPLGDDVVVYAQLHDNAPWYVIDETFTELVWSLDAGPETRLTMFAQRGQQWRATIPGGVFGSIAYRVEATDRNGNVAVSGTTVYQQGDRDPWTDLGFALAGAAGEPVLVGSGLLTDGSPGSLDLSNASPAASSSLFVGIVLGAVPFKGGTLVPVPYLLIIPLQTTPAGGLTLAFLWPAGIPNGLAFYFQMGVLDLGAPGGVALSNALEGIAQ